MEAILELDDTSANYQPDAAQPEWVEIMKLAHEGGQACVYYGQIRPSGKDVALKIFRHADQAEREARALDALRNPRIPRLHGRFRHLECVGLILELCAGQNLREVISLSHPMAFVKSMARELLEVLAHMHSRKIYHNDVAPDNILWSESRGCMLIDFGAASFGPLSSSLPFGRSSYLAPEILFGHRSSPQSDLYSLGATLFEAATKELYSSDTMEGSFLLLKSKFDERDECFFSLIKALLAPTPRMRPPSAQGILESFSWEQLSDPLLVPPDESNEESGNDILRLAGHSFQFKPTGSHSD